MARLVDLTLPLTPGMRGVSAESTCTVAVEGWNASTWHLYSHAGTHMDAPVHFAAGDGTIDRTPLATCIGPAHVIELRPCAPARSIAVADLGSVAESFEPGQSLLLRTGWSAHVDNPALYRDGLPRISEGLARWCVARRVRMLGVEPPSVADVNNLPEVTLIHRILLEGGVTIVEGLTGLDRLVALRVVFGALPLKLHGGDGAPVRAFAIEDIEPETFR
jgi:kynurenine formamidase